MDLELALSQIAPIAAELGRSAHDVACGQIVVGGFHGTTLPDAFAEHLARGERGGAILFKRNVGDGVQAVAALTAALRDAAPRSLPPLVGIDQEGGRVARLGAPLLSVPPMRALGDHGDADLARRVARAQARELAALGITMSFAPVLDVNTCAENPIIGDRSFGETAEVVARLGVAYAQGLAEGGVLACGKHVPGHGDTTKDSHVDLPVVAHPRARLDAVELAPFRAAARAGIDAFMTAHVVYPAIEAGVPATLSRALCTDIVRGDLGFQGVLISDDLEMGAIHTNLAPEDAAVRAVDAGCDMLLVCSDEALTQRVLEALIARARSDARFAARCIEAATRGLAMRRRVPPRPIADPLSIIGDAESQTIARDLAGIRR